MRDLNQHLSFLASSPYIILYVLISQNSTVALVKLKTSVQVIFDMLSVEVLVEHEYIATEQDELTIKPGDIITNVEKLSDGWWEGMLNGKRGLFPDNFVKVSISQLFHD